MTLDLYPLVYLPVAAALRRTDPALEETARTLGLGSWTAFRRVVLPQIRPALLGGSLVVMLALLAEFGAFEILDFRTFTTEIFTELTGQPRRRVGPVAAAGRARHRRPDRRVVGRRARTGDRPSARPVRRREPRSAPRRCPSSPRSRCSSRWPWPCRSAPWSTG